MDILKNIIPSEKDKDKLDKVVNKILKKLNSRLIAAKAIPGGSYAKDTWLKNSHDIDIYILFNKKYDEKSISEALERVVKKIFFRYKKVYGSRVYYQVKKKGYKFEIIPLMEIEKPEEAYNIMDISPFHVSWVNENARKIKDDIRKAKAFCKASHCYGAESYIKGFSGYVLEILTTYYGSFDKLIEAAVNWEENDIIDVKKRNIKISNKSKLSPLVVIDPVQKERNACAALSIEKFNRFKEYSKEYLKTKNENFFVQKYHIPDNALVLNVKSLSGREDIVGAKLLKAYEYIKLKLEEDFGVKESFWYWNNKVIFWYVLNKNELSEYKKHYGPRIDDEENIIRFKHKWKEYNFHEDKGYIYINLRRDHTRLKPYLKDLFKDEFLKERIKKLKIERFINN